MKMLRDLVMIKPVYELKEELDKYGIELPADATNVMPQKGEVIEVGKSVKGIKKGDNVIIDRIKTDNLKDRGYKYKDYLITKEELVLAVILK